MGPLSPPLGYDCALPPLGYFLRTPLIAACDLCCCLLPQCEALRTCRSDFPIATVPTVKIKSELTLVQSYRMQKAGRGKLININFQQPPKVYLVVGLQ